jgi:hypothetical protein
MNMGMGTLQISPSGPPPYDHSQNVSRSSLVSNLAHQRGIAPDQRVSSSGPISPIGSRTNGLRPHVTPRRAPVINPNPRSISEMPNPTAENPTKGFPWAFPDSEPPNQQRHSSSGDSELEHRPSRQNSFAASINSSIYTNDSALPAGQKRFSEGWFPRARSCKALLTSQEKCLKHITTLCNTTCPAYGPMGPRQRLLEQAVIAERPNFESVTRWRSERDAVR